MDDNILMNERRYREITKISDEETARKIDDPETFDKVMSEMRPVNEENLDDYLRGAVILAVESVDYPATDGCIFYLRKPSGRVFVLEMDASGDEAEDGKLLKFTGAVM